ncbi:hypothetical protein GTU73_07510 [Rathayibacter sp. VKM Ac-2804]|uniref:hypothetical protein n=1 Tax=Rathayibacter sp. VKM Ac-2804 TaxID=2609257 RepID=UPI00132EC005|nr:hypothetical protein [Rathayibacter sp. VKM Ac-2804]QHF23866.1 hypothetical protein GTU73_07510 [Rathayibacter sp. VKM Ac-2804]
MRIDVDGVERHVALHRQQDGVVARALVLIAGGGPGSEFVEESAAELSAKGYASLVIDDPDVTTPEQIRAVFDHVADSSETPVPQAILGFSPAGPDVWRLMESDAERIDMAFLVSCALPRGEFDFQQLRATGVRAVFAEGGEVYRSSYQRAHGPMSSIPTPHDFLVYGNGITDIYYDRASQAFHDETWRATLESLADWFDIWAPGSASAGAHPDH